VASIVAVPPFWGRPSFANGLTFFSSAPTPSLGVAIAALALVALALVIAGVSAHRRGDTAVVAAAALAVVLVLGALVTAAVIPLGILGIASHQLRWLWPIATFATFTLLLAIARAVPARIDETVRVAVLGALVVVLAALTLPTYNARTGPTADAESIPVARRLLTRLGPLEGRGNLVLGLQGVRFADPYNGAVMAELQRRGIQFRVQDRGMVHQLGESRAVDGTERGIVLERDREAALVTPPGAELVARVQGLTPAGRRELAALHREAAAYVSEHGLPLDDRGRQAVRAGVLRDAPAGRRGRVAVPDVFVQGDDFVLIVRERLATIDPASQARLDRYVDLLDRWHRGTVAVFLQPLQPKESAP
jgi:hypothetical protein